MALLRFRSVLELAYRTRTGLCTFPLTQNRSFTDVSQESEVKEESIEEIRVRIFGDDSSENNRSLKTLLHQPWNVEEIKNYYPEPITDPLLRDLDYERKRVKQDRLKRRGKGKPPKGQGKRSSGKSRKK
eukprot:g7788.t1